MVNGDSGGILSVVYEFVSKSVGDFVVCVNTIGDRLSVGIDFLEAAEEIFAGASPS